MSPLGKLQTSFNSRGKSCSANAHTGLTRILVNVHKGSSQSTQFTWQTRAEITDRAWFQTFDGNECAVLGYTETMEQSHKLREALDKYWKIQKHSGKVPTMGLSSQALFVIRLVRNHVPELREKPIAVCDSTYWDCSIPKEHQESPLTSHPPARPEWSSLEEPHSESTVPWSSKKILPDRPHDLTPANGSGLVGWVRQKVGQ